MSEDKQQAGLGDLPCIPYLDKMLQLVEAHRANVEASPTPPLADALGHLGRLLGHTMDEMIKLIPKERLEAAEDIREVAMVFATIIIHQSMEPAVDFEQKRRVNARGRRRLSQDDVERAQAWRNSGMAVAEIARHHHVSRSTIYRHTSAPRRGKHSEKRNTPVFSSGFSQF